MSKKIPPCSSENGGSRLLMTRLESYPTKSLHYFAQRRAIDQVLRAACWIVDVDRVRVDAQVTVDGGDDLAGVDGALGRIFSQAVGRADHLAGAHTAADQEAAAHRRPVRAAGAAVDPP